MDKAAVIEHEQTYFDEARVQQERSLSEGDRSAKSAVHKKAAGDLRRVAQERRERVDLNDAVADLSFELDDGEVLYVGKHAIHNAAADLLVIPWQSPAATAFFLASASDPHGVVRKRQFATSKNRIKDFDDTIFADLLERVTALQQPEPSFDDALLRDLERDRTGEMRDIVKTIQSAQYDLVRASLDRLMVVQGGPGTGKTAIALHRVSYLLHNHAAIRDDDVLVVGPNPTFSRYIKALLPALGDVGIVQANMHTLGPISSDRRVETLETAALKGDARMSGLIERALAARVRPPEDEAGSFPVVTRSGTINLDNKLLIDAIAAARSGGTYMQGRAQLRVAITEALARRTPGNVPASAQQVDAALDRLWPSLTPAMFLRELLGSRDRLFEAAGSKFSAQEAVQLYRQSADRVSEETWSDADVALLDEASYLINGVPERYQHVVVDEAQDLSPMQLRSLRRRSNGSMTIVGDIAQSTGPFARSSWDEIVTGLQQELPADKRELEFGYRVPRQVMELAARLLPFAAPGIVSPRVVREAPADPDLLEHDVDDHPAVAIRVAREYAGRGLSVGVVAPDQSRHLIVEEFKRQGVKWRDANAGSLGQGINLISAAESKGLEFDAVVVTSPHLIVEEDFNGHRLLYIALTRTTRYLTVVYVGDPLALPGRDIKGVEAKGVGTSKQSVVSQVGVDESDDTEDDSVDLALSAGGVQRARVTRSAVVAIVGEDLAGEVRETLPPAMWPEVINHLRKQLGVTSEELLDLMD